MVSTILRKALQTTGGSNPPPASYIISGEKRKGTISPRGNYGNHDVSPFIDHMKIKIDEIDEKIERHQNLLSKLLKFDKELGHEGYMRLEKKIEEEEQKIENLKEQIGSLKQQSRQKQVAVYKAFSRLNTFYKKATNQYLGWKLSDADAEVALNPLICRNFLGNLSVNENDGPFALMGRIKRLQQRPSFKLDVLIDIYNSKQSNNEAKIDKGQLDDEIKKLGADADLEEAFYNEQKVQKEEQQRSQGTAEQRKSAYVLRVNFFFNEQKKVRQEIIEAIRDCEGAAAEDEWFFEALLIGWHHYTHDDADTAHNKKRKTAWVEYLAKITGRNINPSVPGLSVKSAFDHAIKDNAGFVHQFIIRIQDAIKDLEQQKEQPKAAKPGKPPFLRDSRRV